MDSGARAIARVVDLRHTAGGLAIIAAIVASGWAEVQLVKWGCGLLAEAIRAIS